MFDTITDYAAVEIIDVSSLLTRSGSLTGYVRLTAAGDLQIDADGGSNSYVTVAHINTAGINVTIRYSTGPGTTATATIVRAAAPVALDLDGDGVVGFIGTDAGAVFDYGGGKVATAWVGPQDGILARDANHDGDVTADEIVFATSGSDLEGLAVYDSNGDGQLTAGDQDFGEFVVWQDSDSDGTVDAGELNTLTAEGIASISLISDGKGYSAAEGGVSVVGTGSFTRIDGSTGVLADAVFMTGNRVANEHEKLNAATLTQSALAGVVAASAVAFASAVATHEQPDSAGRAGDLGGPEEHAPNYAVQPAATANDMLSGISDKMNTDHGERAVTPPLNHTEKADGPVSPMQSAEDAAAASFRPAAETATTEHANTGSSLISAMVHDMSGMELLATLMGSATIAGGDESASTNAPSPDVGALLADAISTSSIDLLIDAVVGPDSSTYENGPLGTVDTSALAAMLDQSVGGREIFAHVPFEAAMDEAAGQLAIASA